MPGGFRSGESRAIGRRTATPFRVQLSRRRGLSQPRSGPGFHRHVPQRARAASPGALRPRRPARGLLRRRPRHRRQPRRRRSRSAWKAGIDRPTLRWCACATAGTSSCTPTRAAGAPRRTPSSTTRCAPEFYKLLARRPADALHLRLLDARARARWRRRSATSATTCAASCCSSRARRWSTSVAASAASCSTRTSTTGVKVTGHQHHRLAGRPRARARSSAARLGSSLQMHGDFRDAGRAVRQGGLDRLPRARRARSARRSDPRARAATSSRAASACCTSSATSGASTPSSSSASTCSPAAGSRASPT